MYAYKYLQKHHCVPTMTELRKLKCVLLVMALTLPWEKDLELKPTS